VALSNHGCGWAAWPSLKRGVRALSAAQSSFAGRVFSERRSAQPSAVRYYTLSSSLTYFFGRCVVIAGHWRPAVVIVQNAALRPTRFPGHLP